MIGRWLFLRGQRPSRNQAAGLAVLFVLALVSLFPLRLALEGRGLSARSVSGSVWSGRIEDLRVGPLPIGDVRAGLRPLSLHTGEPELAASREGFAARLSGSRGTIGVKRAQGSIVLREGLGGFPVSAIGFSDFRYALRGGKCAEAAGSLSVTLPPVSPLMPQDFVLEGKARCDRGALYVPMTGPSGAEHLFLRIGGDGRWRADLTLTGLPPEVSAPLLEQGWSGRPGGIGLSAAGRF